MSSDNIASAIIGTLLIVLFSFVLICLVATGYFYLTEQPPQVKPTAEEIKQIHEKYQEERSNKAANYCFMALGAFFLGMVTRKSQFHIAGLLLLFGALVWDYRTFATAIFLWYVILPALVVGGIVALFKGLFR